MDKPGARLLAVIPARGGSKGLPSKNIRMFAGLPLIAHSILLAEQCPAITRAIVSTDSQDIADAARSFGADVPFIRPPDLAQDSSSLWAVLRHALDFVEKQERGLYDHILLIDPTTPCRLPTDISAAFLRLRENPAADGIIGVSRPDFNPVWHSVIEQDGWMKDMFSEAGLIERRQDAPSVYRINGSVYIWKTAFVRQHESESAWRTHAKNLMYEVPDFSAISIDTIEQFERAELFVKCGLVELPWLKKKTTGSCVP